MVLNEKKAHLNTVLCRFWSKNGFKGRFGGFLEIFKDFDEAGGDLIEKRLKFGLRGLRKVFLGQMYVF